MLILDRFLVLSGLGILIYGAFFAKARLHDIWAGALLLLGGAMLEIRDRRRK